MSSSEQLKAAFDDMIAALERGRQAIESPELCAPPVTELGLAEGYRYLLGWTFGAIERGFLEDPRFPYFRHAIQPMDKATIDNADAAYLSARIDDEHAYKVTGTFADRAHWTGGERAKGPQAPTYVIFETHNFYAGDSGDLSELGPGGRAIIAALDSNALQVEDDGSFEILLAPQRPEGHSGNFMATIKGEGDDAIRAKYLILRFLYADWEHEVAPDLHIAYLGADSIQPAALTVEEAAAKMRRTGEIVAKQMSHWNIFYDQILETHGDRNGDGARFMPDNGMNVPAGANLATGGGQVTNYYSGGTFRLAEDEAMVIAVEVPVRPAYSGFHLSNFWGESLDYANFTSSLNTEQSEPDADGVTRYVVSKRDPGVPNWLDSAGHDEGFLTLRWTYPEAPESLPTVECTVVKFADVRAHLPSETRVVGADERARQIAIRQEHVQRRYRQY